MVDLLISLRNQGDMCFCGRELRPVFNQGGDRVGVSHFDPTDEDWHYYMLTGRLPEWKCDKCGLIYIYSEDTEYDCPKCIGLKTNPGDSGKTEQQ